MTNIQRTDYQTHPYHLVDQSPWPLLTSLALLSLVVSAVLYMHGFVSGGLLLSLGFILTASAMALWFRDIIAEGTIKIVIVFLTVVTIAIAIPQLVINKVYQLYCDEHSNRKDSWSYSNTNTEFGWYLAGLLEGDGHISLPSIGKSKLNRVLNPRIVFTSHINNIGMYSYIQQELGNIGRFQKTGDNVLRYIIGDIEGIKKILLLIHGKLYTPKNIRFNELIHFMNIKYNLTIEESKLASSQLFSNSWFAGFVESYGHFGVKSIIAASKSETIKRTQSESIHILFRLDQRAIDIPTNTSMLPLMEFIGSCLDTSVLTYKYKTLRPNIISNVLSVSITSPAKLKPIIDYFNKYSLRGVKQKDFQDWEKIYNMILSQEHFTEAGRTKIKALQLNMNKHRKFQNSIII